jgi:HEAT repeat protein
VATAGERQQPSIPNTIRFVLTVTALTIIILALQPACQKGKSTYKPPILITQSAADDLLFHAQNDTNADTRRKCLIELAQSKHIQNDHAIETIADIIRRDQSTAVRCAAARALQASNDRRAIDPILSILAKDPRAAGAGPTEPALRTDAVNALNELIQSASPTESQSTNTANTAARLLTDDPDRNVRIAAARLLGEFQQPNSLRPLIAALDQRDFGVVYEAEQSLTRLTGQSFNHDPDAWRDWMIKTNDPFANAGASNIDSQSNRRRWWPKKNNQSQQSLATVPSEDQ